MPRARNCRPAGHPATVGHVNAPDTAPGAGRAADGTATGQAQLRQLAEEQAALRRVATLVARAAGPQEVLAAVAGEVGALLGVDYTVLIRSDLDAYDDVSGSIGNTGSRVWGFSSSVGAPIIVEGRPWGLILVAYTRDELLPADTEADLAAFTELIATAIANTQARMELRAFGEEQAALRRVATLVARGSAPEKVFTTVTAEVGQLLAADITVLVRYDSDDAVTIVGAWASTGGEPATPVGSRFPVGGRNVASLVVRTGRSARIDYAEAGASGPIGSSATDVWGIRSSSGAPVSVGGWLWGVIVAASTGEALLPADTEVRLAGFTELVGTALANAESQTALTASRARIVTAADTARRRIERDLHDGAQQRLVALALELRGSAQASPRPGAEVLAAEMERAAEGISGVLDELREIARGLHPAILAEGGLDLAVKMLARRSSVPVALDLDPGLGRRLPEPVELAAYYVINEALTNAARHAHASAVQIDLAAPGTVVRLAIRDDGIGGADAALGSGLTGLRDRIEALGGTFAVTSPVGNGTTLLIEIPV
jgi:signal transduction histidine kinase